jgi:hypothetical protein
VRALLIVAALAGDAGAKAPPVPPAPMRPFASFAAAMQGLRPVAARYVPGLGVLWHIDSSFRTVVVLVDAHGVWRTDIVVELPDFESKLEVVYAGGEPAFRLRAHTQKTEYALQCTRDHFCREL